MYDPPEHTAHFLRAECEFLLQNTIVRRRRKGFDRRHGVGNRLGRVRPTHSGPLHGPDRPGSLQQDAGSRFGLSSGRECALKARFL